MDRPGQAAARGRRRPRPAADQRQPLLVHRLRGLDGARHLRRHAGLARVRGPAGRRRRGLGCRRAGGESAWDAMPPAPPTGVAVFAADTTIRSLLDPTGTMAHWSEYDRGGHFPGMEVPDLLTEDLRDLLPHRAMTSDIPAARQEPQPRGGGTTCRVDARSRSRSSGRTTSSSEVILRLRMLSVPEACPPPARYPSRRNAAGARPLDGLRAGRRRPGHGRHVVAPHFGWEDS